MQQAAQQTHGQTRDDALRALRKEGFRPHDYGKKGVWYEGVCPFGPHGTAAYDPDQDLFCCYPCQRREKIDFLTSRSLLRMFAAKPQRDEIGRQLADLESAWEQASPYGKMPKEIVEKALAIAKTAPHAFKSGEWLNCCCPLPDHLDKTPSFGVNVRTGGWKCFGCQRSGNARQLIALIEAADAQVVSA
jgi:hypothetical protein